MKEFGSDFHYVDISEQGITTPPPYFKNAHFLASGRHCIVSLINDNRWQRVWFPTYFCEDVIASIKPKIDAEIIFYEDYPGKKTTNSANLSFKEGDVFLVVNYFGFQSFKDFSNFPIPVIEDHSHDIIGEWALNSKADWCFASLRKTLPIPEGGVLWSPKNNKLNLLISHDERNDKLAKLRWEAMELKSEYLKNKKSNKNEFRKLFIETENLLEDIDISLIDKRSRAYLYNMNIKDWYHRKLCNWNLLRSLLNIPTILPENNKCTPFSFILLARNIQEREIWRNKLIENSVYPAILWKNSSELNNSSKEFSDRMLSVHCDARYSKKDILKLSEILNTVINSTKIR